MNEWDKLDYYYNYYLINLKKQMLRINVAGGYHFGILIMWGPTLGI